MFPPMSLIEILDELPRLTHEERRLLCRRALAIDEWCAKALSIWVSVEPVVNRTVALK